MGPGAWVAVRVVIPRGDARVRRVTDAPAGARPYGRVMTAPVLTRYPLDVSAARRRRRRIAVVVAARREQSSRAGGAARAQDRTGGARRGADDHAG
ncbi:hypothetical protein GCM10009528_13420 [Kineococcus aurantiacus]